MAEDFSYKEFFKKYLFLLLIMVVILGILIYFTKISRKYWNSTLTKSIENVLEEHFPYEWSLGNPVEIDNMFISNAVCCEVRNRSTGSVSYAVIIRIGTFYGPLPAVYLYHLNNPDNPAVEFVGYSSLHGRIAEIEKVKTVDKRIQYWQNKIPEIIGK